MADKEYQGFNHSLSRKELQSVCKKYGLPANRSSSDMAKSLASYLENQRLGSMTAEERLYGTQEDGLPLSLKLQLQPEASLNSFRDAGKDCYGLISCPIDRCNEGNYSQAVECNALGCCTVDKFYHKDGYGGGSIFSQQRPQSLFVSQYNDNDFKNKEFPTLCVNRNCLSLTRDRRMNDMPQAEHKDMNVAACFNETTFPSSINAPSVSPSSFQFHVSSEEGINLYVDLNSNPSEWVEKLKSEVSICQNMSHSKFQTFHKELGRFEESSKQMKSCFQLNIDAEKIKDGHMHSGLPPSLIIKENNSLHLDHPGGNDGSLGSTVMTKCARAVDGSEHLEGDQVLALFKSNSDSQEQIISAGTSCAKDGCLITLDSNINSPREKLAGYAVLNISDGPLNLLSMKQQNSKFENEIYENSTLQNGCHLVSPGGIIPGCVPDGSLQIPMPEDVVLQKNALHSPRENGGFVDLVDPKHNTYAEQGGIVGSTELDQETFRTRLPTLVEEQGRSKIINWGKSSECSQDELFENCGERDNVGSNGLGKKRAYIDGDQNDCSVLDAKILRSTKHLIMKVLPRRSMRLVSKIPSFFREQVFTQRHNKVTKGCRERDNEEVLFLKMAIELVKADQESTKQRWCGLLMRLFQPECFDIGKLGSFILEQEVYDLMSAKRDDELKILMAEIEGFIRPMVERNKKVNELMMELNRIPKKSNFTRWNLGQYGDDEPSSPHPDQGFKNSSIGDMGRSLSEVVVEMYGFPPDVALDIQESAATGNLVGEASENASMSDDDLDRKGEGFDPLEYLDHQVFSENCELEDAETLNWKSVRIAKQKLEDLNMKI
ncbi:uncharacterized protein LOC111307754 isoform X1 [Durio zibethinus]|uniref:Uncharacterized protein LOC111307754 isoform X1 n=1 Tax=Durio zibethinus TaxID=66656 RepID=A0A6P6A9X5_DURZI|nr:uncharacterized protein LOC111307754 isoform X1 [Durio zibethinus]XP_022761661.1 uncharacterized protein LOC111307754 isoform X1 [Durio zibethinus]